MRLQWRGNRLYWRGIRKSLAWIKPVTKAKLRWEYQVRFGPIVGHISYGIAYSENDARCACVTLVLDKITTLIKESL